MSKEPAPIHRARIPFWKVLNAILELAKKQGYIDVLTSPLSSQTSPKLNYFEFYNSDQVPLFIHQVHVFCHYADLNEHQQLEMKNAADTLLNNYTL